MFIILNNNKIWYEEIIISFIYINDESLFEISDIYIKFIFHKKNWELKNMKNEDDDDNNNNETHKFLIIIIIIIIIPLYYIKECCWW